jgi:predicted nucleotidyltransferase
MMVAGVPDALTPVLDALSRRPVVRRVWLFGSRARGDHAARSDIDLAIEAPGAGAIEWDAIAQIVESAPTLLGVDLVRLDAASPALQERVRAEGRVLLER